MKQFEEKVEAVKKATLMPEKKQLEGVARQDYKKVRQAISNLETEAKQIQEPTQKWVFQKKIQEFKQKMNQLDKELKTELNPPKPSKVAKYSADTELMGEGGEDGSKFTSAATVLDSGINFNRDALSALDRIERLQNSAQETGQEVLTKLQSQTEKITEVDNRLNDLQAGLDRAKKEVSWFSRQLAGDKCFLMLFGLVVLALVLLVFWKVYSKRTSSSSGTDAPATPTPAPLPPGAPPVPGPPPPPTETDEVTSAPTSPPATDTDQPTPEPTDVSPSPT